MSKTTLSTPTSQVPTLVDLLLWRTSHQADNRTYTFLVDGDTEEAHLTCGQLDQQARQIAQTLRQTAVPGDRALLLYPPGLDYIAAFFGCLYAGIIAVPAYPPNPAALNRTLPRLQAIINDAQAAIVLTTSPILSMAEFIFMQAPDLRNLHWLATDNLAPESADGWQRPDVSGDTIAFLQYTSGSTGTPKGVILTHNNLLNNSAHIYRCFGHSAESQGVIWLPPYHDMGLIGGILQPLYAGFPVTLLSPLDFLQKPMRWLKAVSRYRATTSGGPNFAYDLCARKATPQEVAELDLSSWNLAFNGAEPIRPETLARFTAVFGPCGYRPEAMYPCYGLAEATLIASGGAKAALPIEHTFAAPVLPQTATLIGCGQVLPEQEIRIVNPETAVPTVPGQVGEIWLKGPSIAQGYWNRPEETAVTFHATLAGQTTPQYLRTGDLGLLHDGELYVTGRIKDLIIIRGRNHYPQDIERTAEQSHPALRPGCNAAFALERDGTEQLIIVQEVERKTPNLNTDEVIAAIRQAIAENHELQAQTILLIEPRSIPKTSSGKIQRHACKTLFLNNELEIVADNTLAPAEPTTATTSTPQSFIGKSLDVVNDPTIQHTLLLLYLQEQTARIVHLAPSLVDGQRPLTAFGLDSLMAIELKNEIETSLAIELPMVTFLQGPSLSQLATEILAQRQRPSTPAQPTHQTPTTGPYPLSYGQKALWYLHQLNPQSAAYNLARAVRLTASLDVAALQTAFGQLASRHAVLRTTFPLVDGQPVQKIHDTLPLDWAVVDTRNWPVTQLSQTLREEANRPFNLAEGPLWRVRLYQRAAQETVLLLSFHHIITDFWSLVVFVDELSQLYTAVQQKTASPLPPLPLQFTDTLPADDFDLTYWQTQLAGELPTLSLPTDRPRPASQTDRGSATPFQIPAALAHELKALAQQAGVTPYMLLLAAYQAFLHRLTGQDDIIVGTPTTGRDSAKTANLLGYFVNPVALRTHIQPAQPFRDFLQAVRQTVLDGFAHQNVPFALLVERLKLGRNPSYSPVFQTMFVWQKGHLPQYEGLVTLALGQGGSQIQLGDLLVESLPLLQEAAQFDLTLTMAETANGLTAVFEYNSDLFDPATIRRMGDHFSTFLHSIVAEPSAPISRLPLLSPAVRQELLTTWNQTEKAYPTATATLHQLFEAQVERTPTATALIFGEQSLTYTELNQRANQLAHALQSRGVGPDVLVGVCMERSVEMVVALYAILKAGGAYLPLEPTYPADRLAFMLEDAHLSVVLTQEKWTAVLPAIIPHILVMDTGLDVLSAYPLANPAHAATPTHLAYTIYTSGSTGNPKGAMNSHRGIVNRLLWMQEAYQLTANDRVLQKTPFSFDVSVWEFFWPLITGASLVMAEPGGHLDGRYLAQTIAAQAITTLHFVPSMLQLFLDEPELAHCTSLRQVMCSGEALPFDLQERFFARLPQVQLHNLYGPTEAAVDVAFWQCQPAHPLGKVPIGFPISNIQLYILDPELQPVPLGVAGELHIGGCGLARGYLNRPALTAQKFIPNPFSPEDGSRLYKTGDLCRYLPDGAIEFLGRLDFQVKIRGFRIELGEIEARLAQHTAVREVLVTVYEANNDKRLVAYLTAANGQKESLTASQLRPYLQETLPDHMIPSTFVVLDAFPLSANGKVNRRALPAPQISRDDLAQAYVAPRNVIEQQIATIWQNVLRLEKVGLYDNFFDLGGHSLLLVQVHRELQAQLGRDIPLVKMLERPTIHALAQALSQEPAESSHQKSLDRAAKQRESRRRPGGR